MYSSFQLEEKSKNISLHFSQVAERYRDLRTTDPEPIIYITQELDWVSHLPRIDVADIGCGDGRYSLLFARYLDGKVRLRCIDNNENMLETLATYLKANGISRFVSVKSDAESLPFGDNSFDCIMTFNAVHHFKLRDFLVESARILRDGSLLFIYTRTLGQNSRNIWGRYFPQFCQKETRLYHRHELEHAVSAVPALKLRTVREFKYERVTSLERLIEQAENRHYSTFWFYSEEELVTALDEFQQNIRKQFSDPNQVRWFDENLLLVIEKKG
ncbi:MAG: class I SAM-dependent methyltransferase [Dehalococcoidia bacterium]|nr:MAG: class I SAM-dependent methyltransferase [Dehalococcoidia bacterium]